MVQQAAESVQQASAASRFRQHVEFLNPVNEKAINFLSTEAMDYPCSNMEEFRTLCNLTRQLCKVLFGSDVQLQTQRIDEGGLDGDLCAVITAAGSSKAVAVVWPTAEKLKDIKRLAEDASIQQLYIVNPLWKTEGNLVSEFGIGPWRKANEEFVATFEPSYQLFEQRIGAPSSINMANNSRYASGGVVRVLRAYPGQYEVHVMASNGASQPIGAFPQKPSYRQLDDLIAQARKAKVEIFGVAARASVMKAPASEATEGSTSSSRMSFYSSDEVTQMEPQQLRRVLMNLGLPSAGTPVKLQQRCLAVASAVENGTDLEAAVAAAKRLR
eukprot:jgi/Chrzof1/13925/Cz08g18030.t1